MSTPKIRGLTVVKVETTEHELYPGRPTVTHVKAIVFNNGVMAIEHRSGRAVDLPPDADLTPLRIYRYGDTSLSVTRRAGPGAEA